MSTVDKNEYVCNINILVADVKDFVSYTTQSL
jgi:hypothetical protein